MSNDTMDENEDRLRAEIGVSPDSRRLSRRHRLVLQTMRTWCDVAPDGTVCCSVADLVKATGLSSAGVAFARSDLLRWGCIEVAKRGGGAIPPVYRVVMLLPESDREFFRRVGIAP